MIFKISNFQLGGETQAFGDGNLDYCFTVDPGGIIGFGEGQAQDSFYKVERTDYTQNLPLYLQRKVYTISGYLVAREVNVFKEMKRKFESLLREELTIQVEDRSGDNLFAVYEINARIFNVSVERGTAVSAGKYQIQFTSTDPFIYGANGFDQTYPIQDSSLVFPLEWPLVFGSDTSATINNEGTAPVYPTYYLIGSGAQFTISNQTADQVFLYSGVVGEGQQAIITPREDDAIKARLNGTSVNRFCTNFEALKLQPGLNKLAFGVQGGLGPNTAVRIAFKPNFYAI